MQTKPPVSIKICLPKAQISKNKIAQTKIKAL
jgi:hypothetical protein